MAIQLNIIHNFNDNYYFDIHYNGCPSYSYPSKTHYV
jgi:hypothetical protein